MGCKNFFIALIALAALVSRASAIGEKIVPECTNGVCTEDLNDLEKLSAVFCSQFLVPENGAAALRSMATPDFALTWEIDSGVYTPIPWSGKFSNASLDDFFAAIKTGVTFSSYTCITHAADPLTGYVLLESKFEGVVHKTSLPWKSSMTWTLQFTPTSRLQSAIADGEQVTFIHVWRSDVEAHMDNYHTVMGHFNTDALRSFYEFDTVYESMCPRGYPPCGKWEGNSDGHNRMMAGFTHIQFTGTYKYLSAEQSKHLVVRWNFTEFFVKKTATSVQNGSATLVLDLVASPSFRIYRHRIFWSSNILNAFHLAWSKMPVHERHPTRREITNTGHYSW